MPRLWHETIDAHRRAVHEAVLDAAAGLIAEHGFRGVTMSRVARDSGIGRATLYKYFPDSDAILVAWHERQVAGHLELLAAIRDRPGTASERFAAALGQYAEIVHGRERHSGDIPLLLHGGDHADRARRQLVDVFGSLLREMTTTGELTTDSPVDELAQFCIHAADAAAAMPSLTATRRLVGTIQHGLGVSISGQTSPAP